MSDTPRPGFDRVKTPRTDAFEYWYLGQGNHVSEVFIYARQLECELDEARNQRDKLAAVLNKIADAYPDNPFLYEVRKAFKESWK